MDNKELYHYGVKGMKWGVRKDYVKSTGRNISKKAKQITSNFIAKRKARRAQEEALAREQRIMKTPVKKLTTTELQERSRILAARKQVLDLERSCKQANDDTVSAGKKFVKKLGSDMLTPAILGAGKTVLTDYFVKVGKDKLGLSDKDNPLNSLKKQAEEWDYKGRIASGKLKDKAWRDSNNKKPNDKDDPPKSPNNDTPKPKNPNTGNNSEKTSNNNSSNSTKDKKSESSNSKTETYTGTVEGEGTSKFNSDSNNSSKKKTGYGYDSPIDAAWSYVNDKSTSIVPARSSDIVSTGQSKLKEYNVSGYLLEDKNR